MPAADLSDADLVAESLSGNREAFGQIVERHQTLIASLAYCATGSLTRSEDLAQETFLSAWKQLADLREPARLRAWLCSIVRFLISKEIRRQGRQPEHAAHSLEAVNDWVSPEPLPPDRVITDEEKTILWRSLERIPEIYREPLVLFYREQQSVQTVAQDLGLSEDAVKQRLSRGRKLLQEQVLAFVAGALEQTSPGKSLTLAVMTALPLLATSAGAATVGTALAQNGSMAAKTTTLGGFLHASSKVFLSFVYWMAPVLPLGGYIGYKMGGDRQSSEQARRSVATFWRIIGTGMLLCVFLPPLFLILISKVLSVSGPRLIPFGQIWMDFLIPALIYGVAPLSVMIWIFQRRRSAGQEAVRVAHRPARAAKVLTIWVVQGMTGALVCLVFFSWSVVAMSGAMSRNPHLIPKTRYLSTTGVQKLVAGSNGSDIDLCLTQLGNGYRYFNGKVRENGTDSFFQAPAENSTLAVLAEKGIRYGTRMEGRDFTFSVRTVLWLLGNWAMHLFMPAWCVFIVIAGAGTLLRRRDHQPSEPNLIALTMNERRVDKAFAALAACGMVALAVFLGLATDWKVRHVTASRLPSLIAQRKNARFEVFEYRNGSRKLWISDVRSPEFIAPANQFTFGLLAREGITYQTYLADIDWWYRPRGILVPPDAQPHPSGAGRLGLSQFTSAVGILVLALASGGILWWSTKSQPAST